MNKKGDNDFENFSTVDPLEPPKDLSMKILSFVSHDLNTSHRQTFFKLVLIHSLIGVLTLLFCPQFELSLTNNYSVFHFFHRTFGSNICMALCGGIFLGCGAIAAGILLTQSEIMKIRRSKILYYVSLSSIFLTSFLLLGAEIYLEMAFFWTLGACSFGISFFQFSTRIRTKLSHLLSF